MKKNTQEPLVTLWLNSIYDSELNPVLKTQMARKAAIEKIVEFINVRGLGKMTASRQWGVQFLTGGAGVDRISLEVYRGERLVRKIGEELIDMCVPEENAQNQMMKEHLRVYLELMDDLDKPYLELGGGERLFKLGNQYFDQGVRMWGRTFIGNYTHIIGETLI
jgi:hypothetical protein